MKNKIPNTSMGQKVLSDQEISDLVYEKIIKIKGGCNMSKSTAQQIADLQNKLQALRTKKARQDRREETRQKIILGAEVAKVLNSKPEEINKALVLGLLSKIN